MESRTSFPTAFKNAGPPTTEPSFRRVPGLENLIPERERVLLEHELAHGDDVHVVSRLRLEILQRLPDGPRRRAREEARVVDDVPRVGRRRRRLEDLQLRGGRGRERRRAERERGRRAEGEARVREALERRAARGDPIVVRVGRRADDGRGRARLRGRGGRAAERVRVRALRFDCGKRSAAGTGGGMIGVSGGTDAETRTKHVRTARRRERSIRRLARRRKRAASSKGRSRRWTRTGASSGKGRTGHGGARGGGEVHDSAHREVALVAVSTRGRQG
eukprot:30060-Pelagococcus_subviridis.AAC.5